MVTSSAGDDLPPRNSAAAPATRPVALTELETRVHRLQDEGLVPFADDLTARGFGRESTREAAELFQLFITAAPRAKAEFPNEVWTLLLGLARQLASKPYDNVWAAQQLLLGMWGHVYRYDASETVRAEIQDALADVALDADLARLMDVFERGRRGFALGEVQKLLLSADEARNRIAKVRSAMWKAPDYLGSIQQNLKFVVAAAGIVVVFALIVVLHDPSSLKRQFPQLFQWINTGR